MVNEFAFGERLRMSDGYADTQNIGDILRYCIPGAVDVQRASVADDRHGVDWWVHRTNEKPLGVDVKIRSKDFRAIDSTRDDYALETWSVVERNIVGWTRDAQKQCDYILWFWQDTQRWSCVPFPMLCHVFDEHWAEWTRKYHTAKQRTVGAVIYHSECVYVPRTVVWRKIYERYGGAP